MQAADAPSANQRVVPRAIVLPDYCNTPDAMAVLANNDILLSVPNFTDPTSPGVLMRITPQDEVSLFCKLPLHPQTNGVFPMGIRQAPSGDLYVADCQTLDETPDNSRLLCVRVVDGQPGAVEVVANGLNVANGVAIHNGFVYVTDSSMGKTEDGAEISGIYRFALDERNVQVVPGGSDPHLLATLKTECREIPVGADGIDIDEQGHVYVANCGDHSDLSNAKAELAGMAEVFGHLAVIADPPMLKGRRYGNMILIGSDAELPAEGSPEAAQLARVLLGGAVPAHYKDERWARALFDGTVPRTLDTRHDGAADVISRRSPGG